MMLGDKIPARAERMGMIYKVFEDADFAAASFKIAQTLAAMPTQGLGFTKQALNSSLCDTLEEQLNSEDRLQQKAANTYDYKEGVAAFLEKRPPVFKGE